MKKLTFILSLLLPNAIWAQLQVFELFTDHAILQRDVMVPVWGWHSAGEEVNVEFNESKYKATTDADGKWRVELPATKAGGPYQLTISDQEEQIEIKDIYFGDVWVCSGQSNMEWSVGALNLAEDSLKSFKDPLIRHCKVSRTFAYEPAEHLPVGNWEAMSPSTIEGFTAVGSYFALGLRPDIDVPIGLLNSSWGGSRIEPWMSAESLGQEEADVEGIEAQKAAMENEILRLTGEAVPEKDYGIKNGKPLWAGVDYNDSKWAQLPVPKLWEGSGLRGVDGTIWFRYAFNLTETEAKEGIKIGLGKIDDNDWTYVNGQLVGNTAGYNTIRNYSVSDTILRAGKNVITVHVEDTGGGGGFHGDAQDFFIQTNQNKYPIAGNWKYRLGKISIGFATNQVPIILYNQMIHPMLAFPIKGALWYQGESNANEEGAFVYRDLFKTMIQDWRKRWNVGDFPFFWVQLANFRSAPKTANDASNWAVLRESQTAALALPNTAEASAIDVGETNDIHPKDKATVGKRLSLAARNLTYGQKEVPFRNPTFKSAEFSGNRIIISFHDTADGLIAINKYKYVNGFAVADENGVFEWAKAKIVNGNQIEVTALSILKPTKIRYGWADNPDDLDLYSTAGLPVTPFRYEMK